LCASWVKSILARLHLLPLFLILDVFLDCLSRHCASRSNVVTTRPQCRYARPQEAKLLSKDSGAIPLELIRKMLGCIDRQCGNKQVNVVRHDLKGDDLAVNLFRFRNNQFSQARFNRSGQKLLAIFHAPNEVICNRRNTTRSLSIPAIWHVLDTSRMLSACQVVNGYLVGSKGAASAVLNSPAS